MNGRICPLCSSHVAPLRWRKSELVSGLEYRCRCGMYASSVRKDGTTRDVTIVTHMRMPDLVTFLDGHVPGPGDIQ